MYCIIKCTVQRKQARVKNADLRHPSCTVVMEKFISASPVLNVLTRRSLRYLKTTPQEVPYHFSVFHISGCALYIRKESP